MDTKSLLQSVDGATTGNRLGNIARLELDMPPDPKAFFESAASYSETLSGWALAVLGGSVLALLQRSYLRPVNRLSRTPYLLFGVGWFFLARSIYFGTKVQEVLLAFLAQRQPVFDVLRDAIGDDLTSQVDYLGYGLLTFGLWLSFYVAWWIATNPKNGSDS